MYRLSLKIDGDISIEAFREALVNFIQVLHEVDEAVSGTRSTRWKLADMHRSSPAVLTWVGEPRPTPKAKSKPRDLAPKVAEAMIAGIEKLERGDGRPLAFTDDALDATKRLAHLRMRHGITSIGISGEVVDRKSKRPKSIKTLDLTERTAASVNDLIGPKYTSQGSVEGMLQAVNSRGTLYFVVYDSIWNSRVKCDIPEHLKAKALAAFDKRVLVRGLVSTDSSGHPRLVKAEDIDEFPTRDELPQSLRGLDPDYTDGLAVDEYLKKRWAGDG